MTLKKWSSVHTPVNANALVQAQDGWLDCGGYNGNLIEIALDEPSSVLDCEESSPCDSDPGT
jgi:hypothetical protein